MLKFLLGQDDRRKGIISGIAATICWSSSFIAASYLFRPEWKIDPVSLVAYRFGIGGGLLLLGVLVSGKSLRLKSRSDFYYCCLAALFMQVLMSIFYFSGQKVVPAAASALYIESGPMAAMILINVLSGRCRSFHQPLAAVICLAGGALVLNLHQNSFQWSELWGHLCFIAAIFMWVSGSAYFKKAAVNNDTMTLTCYTQLLASLFTWPMVGLGFPMEAIVPQGTSCWLAILAMGIIPTGIGYFFWSAALKRLPLTEAGTIQNLTPIFTLLGSALILNEAITWSNLTGMIMVMGALIYALRHPSGKQKK